MPLFIKEIRAIPVKGIALSVFVNVIRFGYFESGVSV